jgi:hypothetical protein
MIAYSNDVQLYTCVICCLQGSTKLLARLSLPLMFKFKSIQRQFLHLQLYQGSVEGRAGARETLC